MQEIVDMIRETENQMLLSFFLIMDLILIKKMAEVCTGIDFIMGGHTYDGVPEAVPVKKMKWYNLCL